MAILIFALTFVVALAVVHLLTKTRNPRVPGPAALPLLGNLLDALPYLQRNRLGEFTKNIAKR